MIHSRIKWEGVKMHWQAHREWFYNRKLLHNALEVARWMNVPVLMHTGDFKECHAGVFGELCKRYDDLNFVLAHGWPIDETIVILSQYINVRVDTAFMPVKDVKLLCDKGFSNRTLFGTDVPINLLFYKDMDTTQYVKEQIGVLKKELRLDQFESLMKNKLYGYQKTIFL